MNPNIQQAIQTMANQLMAQGLTSPALQAQIAQNPALLTQCLQQAKMMVTTRLKQNEWRLTVSAQDRKTIIEHILAALKLVNGQQIQQIPEKLLVERATQIEKSFYDRASSKESYVQLAKETLNAIRSDRNNHDSSIQPVISNTMPPQKNISDASKTLPLSETVTEASVHQSEINSIGLTGMNPKSEASIDQLVQLSPPLKAEKDQKPIQAPQPLNNLMPQQNFNHQNVMNSTFLTNSYQNQFNLPISHNINSSSLHGALSSSINGNPLGAIKNDTDSIADNSTQLSGNLIQQQSQQSMTKAYSQNSAFSKTSSPAIINGNPQQILLNNYGQMESSNNSSLNPSLIMQQDIKKNQLLSLSPQQQQHFLTRLALQQQLQQQGQQHQFQQQNQQLQQLQQLQNQSQMKQAQGNIQLNNLNQSNSTMIATNSYSHNISNTSQTNGHTQNFPALQSLPGQSPLIPASKVSQIGGDISSKIQAATTHASILLQKQTALQSQHQSLISLVNNAPQPLTPDQIQAIQIQRNSILTQYRDVQSLLKEQEIILGGLMKEQAAQLSGNTDVNSEKGEVLDFLKMQNISHTNPAGNLSHQPQNSKFIPAQLMGQTSFDGLKSIDQSSTITYSNANSLGIQSPMLNATNSFSARPSPQMKPNDPTKLQQQQQLFLQHQLLQQQQQSHIQQLNAVNPLSLKPIELTPEQKAQVVLSLQGIAPYFRLGSNVYNIFISTNNMERAQKFQILMMMYMRQLQAAESGIFYMSPETVEELGVHLKKHIAEAKLLYDTSNSSKQSSPILTQKGQSEASLIQNPTESTPLAEQDSVNNNEEKEDDLFNFDDAADDEPEKPEKAESGTPVNAPTIITQPDSSVTLPPKEDKEDEKSDDFNFYFDLGSPVMKRRGISDEEDRETKRVKRLSFEKNLVDESKDDSLARYKAMGCSVEHDSLGTLISYNGWTLRIDSKQDSLSIITATREERDYVHKQQEMGKSRDEILNGLIHQQPAEPSLF